MATGGDHTMELVEENLPKLFYDIRVDHLNEDELEYELEIRDILFAREDSMSRKRRALREKIKSEKEELAVGDRTLKRNPVDELRCCEVKLREFEEVLHGAPKEVPPRCQSILLHLGNRARLLRQCVGPDIQSQIDDIQVRILKYLDRFFYNKRQERHNLNAEIGLDQLFDETPNRVSSGHMLSYEAHQSNEGQRAQPSATDSDILGCLVRLGLLNGDKADPEDVRNGLLKLESELYLLRSQKLTNTQSNLINSEPPRPEFHTTYTGTIPKSSISWESGSGNHVRRSESVTLAQWTQSDPVTGRPSLNSLGKSSHYVNSHHWGNDFSSIPTYPIISTQTNPTLSNSVPRVVTSVVPTTSYSWLPEVTTRNVFSISNSQPMELNGGLDQNPYRSSLSGDGWKVMPYASAATVASSYPHAPSSIRAPNPLIQGLPSIPTVLPNTTSWSVLNPGGVAGNPSHFTNVGYNPSAPMATSRPGGTHPLQIPSVNPAMSAPYSYSRKSLPVSKWKVEKYAGTDQGLKLNEFLHLVSQLALSEHVSEIELFDSAFHLFTGPALNWYMSNRSAGRLANWTHLVYELRKTFAHPELDSLVRARIYQRRQQRNETFQEFYFEMEGMFRSMIHSMTEGEKLDVLRRNMRTDYKKALLWKPITNLAELLDAGHQIDASNFSLFAKVFGTEKSVNIVSSAAHNRDGNRAPSQFNTKSKEKNPSRDKGDSLPRKESANKPEPKPSLSASQSGRQESRQDPREGPSKPSRTLQFLIDGYRPPKSNECLYCRQTNHALEQCRNYKGSMCLVCGFKGFETHNCPFCKKNGLQTVENRRPSNLSPDA